RALEFNERVFVHLKEVRRLDVVVPHSVVGAEAGRRDGRLDRCGLWMIRVDIGDGAELIEVASHRHHPKVLRGELDLRVIWVQLPVAHREPPCSPLGLDAAPNMPPGAIVAGGIAAGGARSGASRSWTRVADGGEAAQLARGEDADEVVGCGLEAA